MISQRIYLELHSLSLLLFDRSVSDYVKQRYYFKNQFLVSCNRMGFLRYPKPGVGSFISEIQLTLRVDAICNLKSVMDTYPWSFLPRHPSKATLANSAHRKHNLFEQNASCAQPDDCSLEATDTREAIENRVEKNVRIRDSSNGAA
jgi:hypothetical protein